MQLNHKIELAIKLLQSIPQDGPIELSYSGGKDSDVAYFIKDRNIMCAGLLR